LFIKLLTLLFFSNTYIQWLSDVPSTVWPQSGFPIVESSLCIIFHSLKLPNFDSLVAFDWCLPELTLFLLFFLSCYFAVLLLMLVTKNINICLHHISYRFPCRFENDATPNLSLSFIAKNYILFLIVFGRNGLIMTSIMTRNNVCHYAKCRRKIPFCNMKWFPLVFLATSQKESRQNDIFLCIYYYFPSSSLSNN